MASDAFKPPYHDGQKGTIIIGRQKRDPALCTHATPCNPHLQPCSAECHRKHDNRKYNRRVILNGKTPYPEKYLISLRAK